VRDASIKSTDSQELANFAAERSEFFENRIDSLSESNQFQSECTSTGLMSSSTS